MFKYFTQLSKYIAIIQPVCSAIFYSLSPSGAYMRQ